VGGGAELRRAGGVAVGDGERGGGRGADRGSAGGIGELQHDGLRPFEQRVVDGRDDDRPRRLPRAERQGPVGEREVHAAAGGRAARNLVVDTRGGREIARAHDDDARRPFFF